MRHPIVLAAVAFAAMAAGAVADGGPSFNCKKVHSNVLKTVCASPALSALDVELNEIYRNTLGQPSIDHDAMAKDETGWMQSVLNRCADASCIEKAYRARITALKDKSARAASPAASDETKPFPAPAPLLAEARSAIGKHCEGYWGNKPGFLPGFSAPKGFLPVTSPSGMVFVREKQGTRFAFLAKIGEGLCVFEDVAVMPPATQANAFLQCSYGDPPNMSSGIGMRKAGVKALVGYWEIDDAHGKLIRQPLGVLGVEASVRCQEPETGD